MDRRYLEDVRVIAVWCRQNEVPPEIRAAAERAHRETMIALQHLNDRPH